MAHGTAVRGGPAPATVPAMAAPTIVTCAVTGSAPTHTQSPAVPVTPQEIAASALEAASAGAAVVHIHVRDPETGAPSSDVAHYRQVVEEIGASGSDVIVNLTTGWGGRFLPSADDPRVADPGCNLTGPEERTRHIVELRPEMCSLDVATFNLGEVAYLGLPSHVRAMAARMREAGSLPELEVFEVGHLRLAAHLIETGHIPGPGHFQFCLGLDWALPATEAVVDLLCDLLPPGATWSAFGISRHQMPMVAIAASRGGHVRVGLEDNLYLDRGRLAPSNAALVERAVMVVEETGRRAATPAEARLILGLTPR